MVRYLRRWGAVYILAVLAVGSWAGQVVTQLATGDGWTLVWAATFENWQSEWLQLVFQAVLLLGAKHWLFQVDAEDIEVLQEGQDRMEAKLDEAIRRGVV